MAAKIVHLSVHITNLKLMKERNHFSFSKKKKKSFQFLCILANVFKGMCMRIFYIQKVTGNERHMDFSQKNL